MAEPLSRRGLLRGNFTRDAEVLRPPWSLPEAAFTDACTRCGDCIAACPERIIVKGSGGFPEIDFARGACTFCAACPAACRTGALVPAPAARVEVPAESAGAAPRAESAGTAPPWKLKAFILPDCLSLRGVACRICEDACEPAAILSRPLSGGRARPIIDLAQCTGCGACYSVCPEGAVVLSDAEYSRRAATGPIRREFG